ncbi:MAG: lambda exonuclease family protein, partial [Pseudomonadota bacterium]
MHLIEPGTADWHTARTGAWTASRAPALMARRALVAYRAGDEVYRTKTEAAKVLKITVPQYNKALKDEDSSAVGEVEVTEPLDEHTNLIGEIAVERLTGTPVSHFVTPAMRRGLELEPEAADAYAVERMVALGDSRFVFHPTIERVGATPDRFIGKDGLLEIKVPTVQSKHLGTLLRNKRSIEHEYEWQCHFQMWCTGRAWVDLVSYSPSF